MLIPHYWLALPLFLSFLHAPRLVAVSRPISDSQFHPPLWPAGKTRDAIGAYLSSGFFSSQGSQQSWDTPFKEGDRITVLVRYSTTPHDLCSSSPECKGVGANSKDREVVFRVNGQEVGVVAVPSHFDCALSLAVQPYKGGEARLL